MSYPHAKVVEADEGASEAEERLVDIRAPLVVHREPPFTRNMLHPFCLRISWTHAIGMVGIGPGGPLALNSVPESSGGAGVGRGGGVGLGAAGRLCLAEGRVETLKVPP